jgi:hypothetical protein
VKKVNSAEEKITKREINPISLRRYLTPPQVALKHYYFFSILAKTKSQLHYPKPSAVYSAYVPFPFLICNFPSHCAAAASYHDRFFHP